MAVQRCALLRAAAGFLLPCLGAAAIQRVVPHGQRGLKLALARAAQEKVGGQLAAQLFSSLAVGAQVILALVFRLEATLLLVLSFSTETGLCFPHLIEFFVTCMIFVFKNFIFLVFSMLILKLFNNLISFLLSLLVFKVIHV